MGAGQEEDNDGRLGDQHGGRDLQDGMIAETRTHSSTDTTTHLKGNSFDHNASQLPTERISSPTSSPHPLSDMSSSRKRNTRADEDPFSADESAPIIRHAQGGAQDYNSISPSIPARTSGVENGASSSPVRRTREVENREQRAEAERHAAAQEIKEDSKWRKLLDKYGSVELENKGSVARDHLALERTFLAWLRTSLSFASIGIAVTQLFRLNTTISKSNSEDAETPQARLRHVGKPLGATFVAISILILFIGFHRYFEAQHYVIRGKFPASRGSIMVVSVVAGGLIISSLVVILAVAPGAFEK